MHAANDSESLYEKRTSLARSFVSKLKNKLTGSDSVNEASLSQKDSAKTQIPEGADMLFRPRVDKITLDANIYAVKGPDDFYLSLNDLITAFNFPIAISDDGQSASGWFVREDWRFQLDLASRSVESRGKSFTFTEKDYQEAAGDIMVSGRLVGEWLGMTYDYDLSQQYVLVDAEYTLPIVAQIQRRERKGASSHDAVAVLPRKDYAYDMASFASADVSVRSNYRRSGDSGKGTLLNSTSVGLNGQLLKNDAQIFANMDDRDGLNSVTARLSRDSDRPELLGPLKARSYALGDTDTVDVPLMGQSSQELGVRVSSNPLSNVNYQDTRISGNALPGWDIELYRNDSLIGTLTVDDTGRFEFENVQLYAGDNEFDVYFYGYQGEIRKESLSIPLTADALLAQDGTYDASVTLNDTATYRRQVNDDEDQGSPHVAGKYNFFVGDVLAYAGFQGGQENGDQKLYLGTGFTSIWNGYIFDTNFAADESSEMGTRLGVRKNINDWNVAVSTQVQTDQFSAGTGTTNPSIFQLQGSVYHSYTPLPGITGNVSADAQHRELADGGISNSAGIGIGQGFQNISLNNSVRYDETIPASGDTAERLTNDFSARVRLNSQLGARAGFTYLIRPESQMDRYFATINYRPNARVTVDLEVDHKPDERYTEAELRANYTHEKYRVSPFVRIDSDNDLAAGFNLSTALINDPHETMPTLTSDRIFNKGAVSAFVFLDVNGNMIFDEGDELLPDVMVESVNSRAREKTGEDGYALLKQLSPLLLTDIRVDTSSLPDPFMIPVNRGNSVLPRAGKIFEMVFPVQFSGEVDGTVSLASTKGEARFARSVTVDLLPVDPARNQPITAKAAQDGFYLLSPVPPGQYFLVASAKDAKSLRAARPIPQLLTFNHEGTSFYAQDIKLQQGPHDIDFQVMTPGFFPEINSAAPEYFISIGTQNVSNPLQALYRMRMKNVVGGVIAGLQPIQREGDDVTYYRVGAGGLEAAYGRCQIMSANKLPCQVSVLPVGEVPAAAVATAKQASLL